MHKITVKNSDTLSCSESICSYKINGFYELCRYCFLKKDKYFCKLLQRYLNINNKGYISSKKDKE